MAVIVTRRQTTIVLMGLGLMLIATILALVALTSWFQDWSGQVAALVVVTLAVAELAAGLSFAQAYTKTKEQENVENH